uniref:PHD-type domain-containing protein n=1 Tax=Globodera rostochiensis TaxID=31243 RepID=A0A914I790_GLORO
MTVYESKLRKANIVPVKRSNNSSLCSSPDSSQYCCSCLEIIGGRLYNCSRCNSSFHSICHFPALPIKINKGNCSDWICHRCEIEVQYNRRHLPRIKCNSDSQEKEDALNQSLVRFMLRLSGKDGAPSEDFSEFVNSLKTINSREFTLEKLDIDESYYKLPFDELFESYEPNSKNCFYCKRFVEKKMVSCDFCDTSFCLDCPNPPFTALPNERWMCSFHIEPFIDVYLLSSKRITDRMALWKEHTKLQKTDSFHSVISNFYKKIEAENIKRGSELEANSPKRRKKPTQCTFKVEKQQTNEETPSSPIDVGSPDDARLSIAVEALIKMHNQSDDVKEGDSYQDPAFDTKCVSDDGVLASALESNTNVEQPRLCFFNPGLLNRKLPIFAALKILSGADKNVTDSEFLIPVQSPFVTLGPLKVNSLHNIDLSGFTHCKMLGTQQALIFFDKAKLAFEMVAANLFVDESFPFRKCAKSARRSADLVSECACQKAEVGDEPTFWLLDPTRGIVPSQKSAVLWNGAIIRIGCLRLHFIGLGIL